MADDDRLDQGHGEKELRSRSGPPTTQKGRPPGPLDERTSRQLLTVRHYLALAAIQLAIDREPTRFAGINLLHEAFEATLIAAADHLDARVPERASIEQLMTAVEAALDAALPFRARIQRFNRARVAAKHALTLPDDGSLRSFAQVVPEFVAETVRAAFGVELEAVSLIALLADGEVRQLLGEATAALAAENWHETLLAARREFYVLFEKDYDVSAFAGAKDGETYGLLDARALCRAPAYARSGGYVARHVKDPHDNVVLDHSRVEADCLKLGIEVEAFWNVWRLSPRTWRRPDGTWVQRHDLSILCSPSIADDSRYVAEAMIDMALRVQAARARQRTGHAGWASIGVREAAPLYERASLSSAVAATTPPGTTKLGISEAVQGLDTDDWFWRASHVRKGGPFLSGYLHVGDTLGEPEEPMDPFAD